MVSTLDESSEIPKSYGCYCENIEIATEKGKLSINIKKRVRKKNTTELILYDISSKKSKLEKISTYINHI